MSKEQKIFSKSIKTFHIICLSCLLSVIFILNSNYVNKQRALTKLDKEQDVFFQKLIKKRKLEYSSDNYADLVCSKASKDLIEYYESGDPSKIGLSEGGITCEEKDEDYMKALIAIVNNFISDDEGEETDEESLYMDYAKRLLPMVTFLGFSVLSILGWIICCFCCCCNCCCCCCCKKPKCKKVCFGITYFFYVAVVGVCIFGFVTTQKVFKGMRDTSCSFLQFLDQVLEGEIKKDPPFWAGVNNITDTLTSLKDYIQNYGSTSYNIKNQAMLNLNTKENEFLSYMNQSGYELEETFVHYSRDYSSMGITGYPLEDIYILDIVKNFGKQNSNGEFPENSILEKWKIEYSLVAENARDYLNIADNSFDNILSERMDTVTSTLEDGKSTLSGITEPFQDLYNNLGEVLNDINDLAEDYGTTALNSIFTFLMVLNINLGLFIILICICSMKHCTNCCCCRCLFKCCAHLSWNFLALMMIFSFLIGSLLGILGTLGGDIMSFLTYILSDENFDSPNPVLINKLGNETLDYLKTIFKDGNISGILNLGSSLGAFENINTIQNQIADIQNNFTSIMSECYVYNQTIQHLENMPSNTYDVQLLPENGFNNQRNEISYKKFIEKINEGGDQYSWDFDSPQTSCDTSAKKYNPKHCRPSTMADDLGFSGDKKKYAEILNDTDNFIETARQDTYIDGEGKKSYKQIINTLRDKYVDYLGGYINTLENFSSIIDGIMGKIRPLIGEGDMFSFLNLKFIGNNLKVILKYLKEAFGRDLYSIGVGLILAGCSLIFSISCTLLLLAIINAELKQHINIENHPMSIQPGSNQGMSVSRFKLNNPPSLPLEKV